MKSNLQKYADRLEGEMITLVWMITGLFGFIYYYIRGQIDTAAGFLIGVVITIAVTYIFALLLTYYKKHLGLMRGDKK